MRSKHYEYKSLLCIVSTVGTLWNQCPGGSWQYLRSTLSYIMNSLINNKALWQKSLNHYFWGFYFWAAFKSIVAGWSEALMGCSIMTRKLKKLLALVTRGERTREAKTGSCQTAKEVRGNRKLAVSKGRSQRTELRQGWKRVKGRKGLGTSSEGSHTHIELGSSLQGWWRGLSRADSLSSSADTQMGASPSTITVCLYAGVQGWHTFQDEWNADSDWGRTRQLCFSRWTLWKWGVYHMVPRARNTSSQ